MVDQAPPVSSPDLADAPQRASTATSRRDFLKRSAAVAGATAAGAALVGVTPRPAEAQAILNGASRSALAHYKRIQAANQARLRDPLHVDNGDEARYHAKFGSYSKGLPHNGLGEVDLAAWGLFAHAAKIQSWDAFEAIPMGGPLLLKNPLGGVAYLLEGADPGCMLMPAAPAFASAELAGEIVENYWQALLRDVPFADYATHPLAAEAVADLNAMTVFRGPKVGGQVTPGTLFRGLTPGDLVGPYLSQFMWLDTPFGAERVDRQMRTVQAGVEYMTDYAEWLNIQRGGAPSFPTQYDPTPRYPRNGRDLGEWVHIDVLVQAYFNAMLTLYALGAPTDSGDPYRASQTSCGFGTLGTPYTASILAAVAKPALCTVWHQKWFVHRRLRPEAYAGRVHNHLTGAAAYPIHADVLNSDGVQEIFSRFDTYLLPMAFPEGSPAHPAYGAGHATVAGACVTVLKAFFDESWVIPNPVEAATDGLSLVPWTGASLTVGGELNKLASNVAIGRNLAGVHWRSDATESLKLGEDIAIRFLREEKLLLRERFSGWSLTKFDGTVITV